MGFVRGQLDPLSIYRGLESYYHSYIDPWSFLLLQLLRYASHLHLAVCPMFYGTHVMMETGSEAMFVGDALRNDSDSYPTVNCTVDGSPCESLTKSTTCQSVYLVSRCSRVPTVHEL